MLTLTSNAQAAVGRFIRGAEEPVAGLRIAVTVDFLDGMEGGGFKFENPNATKSCGCGKSFSA